MFCLYNCVYCTVVFIVCLIWSIWLYYMERGLMWKGALYGNLGHIPMKGILKFRGEEGFTWWQLSVFCCVSVMKAISLATMSRERDWIVKSKYKYRLTQRSKVRPWHCHRGSYGPPSVIPWLVVFAAGFSPHCPELEQRTFSNLRYITINSL